MAASSLVHCSGLQTCAAVPSRLTPAGGLLLAVAGCRPAQVCLGAAGPGAAGGPVTEEGAMRAAIRRAFRAIDEEVVGEVSPGGVSGRC